MSIAATKWARTKTAGGPGPKAVLMNLAERANVDAECFPSQKKLASELEMDERTVRRHIQVLIDRGLITTKRRHRDNGSRTSNGYKLAVNLPDIMPANQEGITPSKKSVDNSKVNRTECPLGDGDYRTICPTLEGVLPAPTTFEPSGNRTDNAVSSLRSLPDASVGRLINNEKKTEGVSENFGRFMPLLRELNYRANGTDASILKAALAHIQPDELERAIRGLALLRDNGRLEIKPGEPLSMRVLHAKGEEGRLRLWSSAVDAYNRHLERTQKAGATGPRRLHVNVS